MSNSKASLETSFQSAVAQGGDVPVTPVGSHVDALHGRLIPDQFRWLEDLADPAVFDWAQAHTTRAVKVLAQAPNMDQMRAALERAWTYETESLPTRKGEGLYFSNWDDGIMKQSCLVVRSGLEGERTIVLDPNTWSEDGTISMQTVSVSPSGRYVAYARSAGGTDASTLYILDRETGENLADIIPECRWPQVDWKDDETEFYYTFRPNDGTKRVVLKHHRLGDDPAQDKTIFVHPNQGTIAHPVHFRGSPNLWIWVGLGTDRNNGLYLMDFNSPDEAVEVFPPGIASLSPVGEHDGYLYAITTLNADRGRLVRFKPGTIDPATWETVIAEPAQGKLHNAELHRGRLYTVTSIDTADQLAVHDKDGQLIHIVDLPAQSTVNLGRAHDENTHLFLSVASYLKPATQYRLDTDTLDLQIHRSSACPVDLSDCVVDRVYAPSRDGTLVPMTVIRHPDTPLDGSAALCLYGYGGFNEALKPGFTLTQWAWVKSGGMYAIANLRGGGEFGQAWYDSGRGHNKQNVFDDFIGCAEHLVAKGYTSAGRLMSYGGSNGGLLTLATMIQRPDLFGAVLSSVPVTDLLRFSIPTFGAYWKSDYNDPQEKSEDLDYNLGISPYHTYKPGTVYPPLLITSAHGDDRVVPWHAYKMTAALTSFCPESPVLLKVKMKAGHGAGQSKDQAIDSICTVIGFGQMALGPFTPEAGLTLTATPKAEGTV